MVTGLNLLHTLSILGRTLKNRHYYPHFTNHIKGSLKKFVQAAQLVRAEMYYVVNS